MQELTGYPYMDYITHSLEMQRSGDIQLLYCVQGAAMMRLNGSDIDMKTEDAVGINVGDFWSLTVSANAVILNVRIEAYRLKKMTGKTGIRVLLNTTEFRSRDFGLLHYLFSSLVRDSAKERSEFKVTSLYYLLWDSICAKFLQTDSDKADRRNSLRDEVLGKILEENRQSPSLTSMAEEYHMSASAFSRYFHRETGENFMEFVRNVRLDKAKDLLLATDKPVTDIAFECGFASLSSFHRNFRACVHMSPGDYRIYRREQSDAAMQENVKKISRSMEQFHGTDDSEVTCESRSIHANAEKYIVCDHFPEDIINMDMAENLLDARIQDQLRYASGWLGIRYVRLSNPFSGPMQIRMGHQTEKLNFEKLDTVFDFLISLHVAPILELPEKLNKIQMGLFSESDQEGFQKSMYRTQFEDLAEWQDFFAKFLRHLMERYTVSEVSGWKFEIWYDAEHYTGLSRYPFMEFYRCTYKQIRKFLPGAEILASGLTAMMDERTLREILRFWKESDQMPDGLSLLIYPYSRVENETEVIAVMDGADGRFIRNELERYRCILQEEQYPETPLWVTEWNTSLSQRNAYNDSTAKGCHMLTQMTDAVGLAAHMGYWNLSDWNAQGYDTDRPFFGGGGLVSKDGIPKPAFWTIAFTRFLGNKVLAGDSSYLLTRRGENEYSFLFFNPRKFNALFLQGKEKECTPENLPYIFRNKNSMRFVVNLSNLENGNYQLAVFRMREEEDNPLAEWKRLGYQSMLRQDEVDYLKAICIPRRSQEVVTVENGTAVIDLTLGANDFALILFHKMV